MNTIKKAVFVVNVDNYYPDMTQLTMPLIRHFAQKIGAELVEITQRQFQDYPAPYEKLQIKRIAKERGFDWNIYIDIDALVHPDLFDPTLHISKDTVMHNAVDMASNRWKYDEYFMRDGRNIGSCNWFTIASDWCLDLWTPLEDLTLEEAVARINPIQEEVMTDVSASHLLDDFTLSRNIAKYGLKLKTLSELLRDLGQENFNYFWHNYQMKREERVRHMCLVIRDWKCLGYYPKDLQKYIVKVADQLQKELAEKKD